MKHLLALYTEVVRRSRGKTVAKMLHGLSCEVSSQDHGMYSVQGSVQILWPFPKIEVNC